MAQYRQCRQHLYILLALISSSVLANEFEPYSLNGGLVSAVAGRDFVLIASDTRLTDGGYEILSRTHLQSRLWAATSYSSSDIDRQENSLLVSKDGSVNIPKGSPLDNGSYGRYMQSHPILQPPTLVASAGCASDCETLKRQLRAELLSHTYWNYGGNINGSNNLSPNSIANVLGQTLYSRRGFPFYSFCILAGLEDVEKKDSSIGSGIENDVGGGVVHVYDAIGSHERVAVASAGTGKEMLQPILDRLFASSSSPTGDDHNTTNSIPAISRLRKDGRAVQASEQRLGLKLQPPVKTFVTCSAEEAITLVVKGYRSVAEREISVGDEVVLCLIKKAKRDEVIKGDVKELSKLSEIIVETESGSSTEGTDDHRYTMQVLRFPLKSH